MTRYLLGGAIALLLTTSNAFGASTSRNCLDGPTRDLLSRLEAKFGTVKLVSTCRPGARMPSGHVSWHARNKAFDFIPPKGRKGDVMVWLSQNSPGVTMSYRMMAHVHTDTGNFKKTIYAAKDEESGWKAVAIWKQRAEATQVAARPPVSPGPVATLPEDWIEEPKPAPVQRLLNIIDYLIHTATVGNTMRRQTPEVALKRLHPELRNRLAGAFRQARAEGLKGVGCFSAYRPPGFGVGGWRDKYQSQHSYGLACDVAGIGRPGSATWKKWHAIATAHRLYNPYIGTRAMRWEWNHYAATPTKRVLAAVPALRNTINAKGPIDEERMWAAANALIDKNLDNARSRARHVRHTRVRTARI